MSGLASLGIIPIAKEADGVEDEIADPRSGMSEAYRSLCTGPAVLDRAAGCQRPC